MDVSGIQRRHDESTDNSIRKRGHHLVEPTGASKTLVFLLIVAAVLVIVTLGLGLVTKGRKLVKADQYQAVFLTNGQVYFGKLSDVNSAYVSLQDIYYLQQQQDTQQVQPAEKDQQSNISLVKLGSELHGPEDEMFIDRDKVIFWENLKADGKVVQAIKQNTKQ